MILKDEGKTIGFKSDDVYFKEKEKRVRKALAHAREMLELYKSIPTGSFGAAFIQRDIEAVEQGDHSEVAIKRLEDIPS